MPTPAFHYQELFELGPDDTEYRLLTKEHVKVESFAGKEMLVVDPQALTLLASQAFHDINFFLRPKHLRQVAAILEDPEASENDRMVALTLLKNADVASAGLLPFCQDTGTAIVLGKKGQQVWTGGGDEAGNARFPEDRRQVETLAQYLRVHRHGLRPSRLPAGRAGRSAGR